MRNEKYTFYEKCNFLVKISKHFLACFFSKIFPAAQNKWSKQGLTTDHLNRSFNNSLLGSIFRYYFWLTDPKIFIQVAFAANIFLFSEVQGCQKHAIFLVKIFQKGSNKNCILNVFFFKKFACSAEFLIK